MRIGDIARLTGLTVHTLRYYEQIGLLPLARRDGTGRRVYEKSILAWIAFLGRLKTTGMPIREMLRYAQLRAQGERTEAERMRLLAAHREAVNARVVELQSCLIVLDEKLSGYTNFHGMNDHATHYETAETEAGKPIGKGQADPVGD